MSAHGRAQISSRRPRALGICDRCGFQYNHDQLDWQTQWTGPKLQNLRILVCRSCLDIPQEQLRTIVLPPDPVPIANPRPEDYVAANNPNSPIGQSPNPLSTLFFSVVNFGTNWGTLTQGAGTWSAFDGNVNKPLVACAYTEPSTAGFNNYIGKIWSADPSFFPFSWPGYGLSSPYDATISGMSTAVQRLIVSSFTAVAPNDRAFLGTGNPTTWKFQGTDAAGPPVDLATGTTTGAVGETLTVTIGGGTGYQAHSLLLAGDGTNSIAVAQLSIYTANRGTGGIPGV